MAKRGRPTLAVQTLEEALRAVAAGTAPKRPRNEYERLAGAKTRGRPRNSNSTTRQAAELAAWYMQREGLTRAEAVKLARTATGANAANIRKYLRQQNMPMVQVAFKGRAWFGAAMAPVAVPMLVGVEDLELRAEFVPPPGA